MDTKFKRHTKVKLLRTPDPEYVEYHEELAEEEEKPLIEKGMKGRVNMILPNGQYHVEILDSAGNILAYCSVSEDDLEAI
jgi:hypothetical protein